MKNAFILAVFTLTAAIAVDAMAGNVRGYTKSNGTYVAPHTRSAPDGNPYNNQSQWK